MSEHQCPAPNCWCKRPGAFEHPRPPQGPDGPNIEADTARYHIIELVEAINAKWRKTTPPKELLEPLRGAMEFLGQIPDDYEIYDEKTPGIESKGR